MLRLIITWAEFEAAASIDCVIASIGPKASVDSLDEEALDAAVDSASESDWLCADSLALLD